MPLAAAGTDLKDLRQTVGDFRRCVSETADPPHSFRSGRPVGERNPRCAAEDAEPVVAAFVPAEKQNEILMLLRLDRALLKLFAARGRNMTAYRTAKAKYDLS